MADMGLFSRRFLLTLAAAAAIASVVISPPPCQAARPAQLQDFPEPPAAATPPLPATWPGSPPPPDWGFRTPSTQPAGDGGIPTNGGSHHRFLRVLTKPAVLSLLAVLLLEVTGISLWFCYKTFFKRRDHDHHDNLDFQCGSRGDQLP